MRNKKSGLFLWPGMGKTVISLSLINDLMYDYFEVKKVLVIATKYIAENTWPDEILKWDHTKHLTFSVAAGSGVKRRLKALNQPVDICIINRDNVAWLVKQYADKWPFDMVVVDELSSFKSHDSQRFKALKRVMPQVKRFIGLTGTPAPNDLIDLWPQMYLIDRGERLGRTVTMFRQRYFNPGWTNGHIVYKWNLKPGGEEEIFAKIGDVCMSLSGDDWLSVPDRIDTQTPVTLPPKLMKEYKTLERDMILQLENQGTITAPSAAVVTNKLMQFANGAIYDENRKVHEIHRLKLEALEALVESANGKPVIVFYAYQHDLSRIQETLKDYEPRILEKSQDISDWNAGKIKVFLLHPASAGHGLNLQHGGNIIVWFGLTFSLELYIQANARLHRQGQTEKVLVHHIIAKGTIDEYILEALAAKNLNQNRLLNAVKARVERR